MEKGSSLRFRLGAEQSKLSQRSWRRTSRRVGRGVHSCFGFSFLSAWTGSVELHYVCWLRADGCPLLAEAYLGQRIYFGRGGKEVEWIGDHVPSLGHQLDRSRPPVHRRSSYHLLRSSWALSTGALKSSAPSSASLQ